MKQELLRLQLYKTRLEQSSVEVGGHVQMSKLN